MQVYGDFEGFPFSALFGLVICWKYNDPCDWQFFLGGD